MDKKQTRVEIINGTERANTFMKDKNIISVQFVDNKLYDKFIIVYRA